MGFREMLVVLHLYVWGGLLCSKINWSGLKSNVEGGENCNLQFITVNCGNCRVDTILLRLKLATFWLKSQIPSALCLQLFEV